MGAYRASRRATEPAPGGPHLRVAPPRTTGEKLGHLWAAIFLALVVVLTVLLAGKGCFGG